VTAIQPREIRGQAQPAVAIDHEAVGADELDAARADTPELVGRSLLDACARAREAGLRVAVSVRETETAPWGLVLQQSPMPGERIRSGGRVGIVVSGRPPVAVPDVSGRSPVAAADTLRSLGLRPIAIEQVTSRTAMPGTVVRTSPRAGSLLSRDANVLILVARAPASRPTRRSPGSSGA
jgi:serine/threonine-protein kinase